MRLPGAERNAAGSAAKAGILVLIILAGAGTYVIDSSWAKVPSQAIQSSSSSQSIFVTSGSQSYSDSTTENQTSTSAGWSTVSTTSGGALAIGVSGTISDQPEAQKGDSVYIYELAVEDLGQSSYPVNESFFTMVTASGADYETISVSAIQRSLSSTTIVPGQLISGQIAFEFPNSQSPARLEYSVPGSIVETLQNLPSPSASVSEPSRFININVNYVYDVSGYQDLYWYPYVQNSTFFFYTGQAIAIGIPLADVIVGSTVTVSSIVSATPALNVIKISPSFPISIIGASGGDETNVMVYMLAPPTSFMGTITLNITANEVCC